MIDGRHGDRSARVALRACSIVVCLSALATSFASAQQEPLRPYPELRSDAVVGRPNAASLGAGLQVPLGYYARFGVDVSGGVARSNGESLGMARGDALVRFLLDPFRETPLALSAGAGVSVRYVDRDGWRPYLALLVDVEARRGAGVTPAFQLGLGGGLRLGIALRWSSRAYR
jgi:hypothetical protein